MHKITLVCSAHRENGLCNAGELLKIIRAIDPEAVFEEIRPADFDSYCKHGIRWSVEALAITKYLEIKSSRRAPVDRYDIPDDRLAETKREFDCVLDYAEQNSREYQLLNEENDRSVFQYGFSYLNSADFEAVSTRMSEIEDKTINESGNQGLIRALDRWRHLLQGREVAVVDNIYAYCRECVFDTGLFLVGAAHKTAIVKAIEKHSSAEADLVDWKIHL